LKTNKGKAGKQLARAGVKSLSLWKILGAEFNGGRRLLQNEKLNTQEEE